MGSLPFTFQDRLLPADSRTIRMLAVVVPPGARQLRLDLTYAPRAVEDRDLALGLVRRLLGRFPPAVPADALLAQFWPLRNLLNIGVFDPRGRFRGRWDRNRPEQRSEAVVAEQGSDAGMLDGAMPPGQWTLGLEVHQILTPVEYTLRVECRDEIPGTGTDGGPARRGPQPKAMPEPAGGGRGEWLLGELHVHSTHSDGKQSVPEVAAALLDGGVDFLALTDHNTTSGLRELPPGTLTIPGFEWTTFHGHATCLGVDEFISWYEVSKQASLVRPFREMVVEVHAAGGVVTVAHPFAPPSPLCAGCRWEFPEFSWTDPDLLEIWNGDRDEHAAINARALALWDDLLGQGRRIVAVAGSDLHDTALLRTKHYARTLVYAMSRTPEAILHGLRAGRAIVTAGPHPELTLVAGDTSYGIGETAVVGAGQAVTVRGAIPDAHPAAEVQFVLNGEVRDRSRQRELTLRPHQPGWVRLQVIEDGMPWAVTNPIYLDVR